MKIGFSAGCSLEVTLKFADYENLKPSYWAGVSREWESSEGDTLPEYSDILTMIGDAQDACRKICEDKIDADIYDVKQVKVFEQILYKKGKK
jgi:hypothetical protein